MKPRILSRHVLIPLAGVVAVGLCFFVFRFILTTRDPSKATKERPFRNSLGMKFVPAGTERVLFCVWDTRVKDFEAFVKATGYDAVRASLYSQIRGLHSADGKFLKDGTWKSPGFKQGPRNPVVGVNWYDAQEFCRWLTQKEQREGLLTQKQSYRLPMDEEWSRAVGSAKYPWGDEWPPPAKAGNYIHTEVGLDETNGVVRTDHDGFLHTSPVGSFKPNGFGLYDMGGNVWQWCMDRYRPEMNSEETRQEFEGLGPQMLFGDDKSGPEYRVLRGGSWDSSDWDSSDSITLASSFHSRNIAGARSDSIGFRCVLWLRLP